MTRIRFDECVSKNIVNAIRVLGLPSGIEIEHPSDLNQGDLEDVDWLQLFKESGGRCIVTGDTKMRGRINERLALQASGFVAIFPPNKSGWYQNLKKHGQAAYLIRWIDEIARLACEAPDGDHYLLPPTFDVDPVRIVTLRRLSGPSFQEAIHVAGRRR